MTTETILEVEVPRWSPEEKARQHELRLRQLQRSAEISDAEARRLVEPLKHKLKATQVAYNEWDLARAARREAFLGPDEDLFETRRVETAKAKAAHQRKYEALCLEMAHVHDQGLGHGRIAQLLGMPRKRRTWVQKLVNRGHELAAKQATEQAAQQEQESPSEDGQDA